MQRIVVVGSSSAGKTTLAAALAARLGVRHVELDGLYWGPHWTGSGGSPEADERFRLRSPQETVLWLAALAAS